MTSANRPVELDPDRPRNVTPTLMPNVPAGTDLILHRNARQLGLHHRLVRRPRISREFDELLRPRDPWIWAAPIGDLYADGHLDLGYAERTRGGLELLSAASG